MFCSGNETENMDNVDSASRHEHNPERCEAKHMDIRYIRFVLLLQYGRICIMMPINWVALGLIGNVALEHRRSLGGTTQLGFLAG